MDNLLTITGLTLRGADSPDTIHAAIIKCLSDKVDVWLRTPSGDYAISYQGLLQSIQHTPKAGAVREPMPQFTQEGFDDELISIQRAGGR